MQDGKRTTAGTAAALATILSLATSIAAQQMPSRIGQTYPPLHFAAVLQQEQTLPRAGHPLVIEYWATWCPGCVANITHLNALADEFQSQGVDFLLLTNEDPKVVQPFLLRHPMHGMVAIDPGFSTNSGLQEPGLPFTMLVGSDSRIAAATRPENVTPALLTALLHGTELPLAYLNLRMDRTDSVMLNVFQPKVPPADVDAATRVLVRPGKIAGGREFMWNLGDGFYANGLSLRKLLAASADVTEQQIVLSDDLNAKYSVQAWVPPLRGYSVLPLVLASLEATAGITRHSEKRPMKVQVVRAFPGNLTAAPPHEDIDLYESGTGKIDSDSLHLETLRSTLETFLSEPVVVESPVKGTFAIHLKWDAKDKDGLQKALAANGITVKEEIRQMPVLVFTANEEKEPK